MQATKPGADSLPDGPAPWAATVAGVIPFVSFSLFMLFRPELAKILAPGGTTASPGMAVLAGWVFLAFFLLIPALGVCVGWVKGFPRWSFPYLGFSLLMSAYMMSVATPGVRILGHTFEHDDLWGWRAWIPLGAALLVALLASRSLRPLLRLFSNAWRDWTVLSFMLFGLMPLLSWIAFDEVQRSFELPFQIAITLIMAGTALAYMRSDGQAKRALSLLAGILAVAALATFGPALYWIPRDGMSPNGLQQSILLALVVSAVMMAPAVIGALNFTVRRLRQS